MNIKYNIVIILRRVNTYHLCGIYYENERITYERKNTTRHPVYTNIYCIGRGRIAAAANPFIVVVAIGVFRSRSHAIQIS